MRFAALWGLAREIGSYSKNAAVAEPMRTESPFTRYRGIGNPGIDSGKRSLKKRLRESRGK
jgi:hypothetical protein